MLERLLRDSAIYSLAALLSRAIGLTLLPVYAFALDPAQFGAFDLVTTLGVLVALVVPLEVSQGLGRLYSEGDAKRRQGLVNSAWWFTVVMLAAFVMASNLLAPQIASGLLGSPETTGTVEVAAGYIALNGLFFLAQMQLRWSMRSGRYLAVNFLYSMAMIVMSVLAVVLFHSGLPGLLAAQSLATALGVTGCIVGSGGISIGLSFDRRLLAEMLRYSTPLVPSGVASFAMLYFNRLALAHFGSLSDVAIYGVANRFGSMITLLIVGIQGALMPLVYSHYRSPETPRQIARLFAGFSALAMTACLALTVATPFLVRTFAGTRYLASVPLVALLSPALLLSQMYIFAPGIAIAKKTYTQLTIVGISGAVSVSANIVLVPPMGSMGAAIATLVSSATMFVLWAYVSQRHYPVPFAWPALGISSTGFIAALVGSQLAEHHLRSSWAALLTGALLTIAFLVVLTRSRLVNLRDVKTVGLLLLSARTLRR
ncbi:MAG TPA: oligosaccharide flippase family protein [Nocardioidaceae bacterium]|nr:oligosaccharide flippase family protein [Nocardioidaceae bacterium]